MRLTVPSSTGGNSRRISNARSRIFPVCSRSVTIHPREARPQKIARPLHSHLERRLADAGDAFDLLVGEAFHVMQQKNLAIVLRHLGECATNLVAPLVVEDR